jgi:hypothetical protein
MEERKNKEPVTAMRQQTVTLFIRAAISRTKTFSRNKIYGRDDVVAWYATD